MRIAAALAALALCACSPSLPRLSLEVADLDGLQARLEAPARPLLVNFWATW